MSYSDFVKDREGLDRWRAISREGDGHDMCSANKNTVYRFVQTVDTLLSALQAAEAERDAAREQGRALRAALSGLDASLRYDENDANADPDTFGDVHASVNVTVLRAQIASALTPENSHEA